MARTQRIVKNLLLAFVLVSIGFALGKHSARQSSASARLASTGADGGQELPVRLRVYYLHATFRCATCNAIEKLTRDLLDQQFSKAMADGRIEWQEADFQQDEALARRFEVIASCVVVAKVRGENVLDYQRLDKVWTLLSDVPQFNAYVSDAIRAYLPERDEGDAP